MIYDIDPEQQFEKAVQNWKQAAKKRLVRDLNGSDFERLVNHQDEREYDEFDERLVMNSSVAY